MDRNVRDKLYKKKFKMPSRKEEYIIVFLATCIYGCPFLQKLMFPSSQIKYIKPNALIFLLTNHNPQTNTRNISETCIVRKKKTIRHEQNRRE